MLSSSSRLLSADTVGDRGKLVVNIKDNSVHASCPNCVGTRNCRVVAVHDKEWADPSVAMHGGEVYRILECRGCETPFFQKVEYSNEYAVIVGIDHSGNEEWDDGDVERYWPITQKLTKPHWHKRLSSIDDRLDELVQDIYVAVDHDLNVLAGIGVRTAFDCASELLGVDENLSFKKKLQSLLSKKKISLEEMDALDILVDAGSASAHRGWSPTVGQLETMIEILNAFLYRAFVVSGITHKLKKHIPKRFG